MAIRLQMQPVMDNSTPTVEQIAEVTKISPRYLRAIESGRFGELPGGIYDRSYIRQYAAATRRDSDELLSLYMAECNVGRGEVVAPPPSVRGSLMRFLFRT
jgi:cytoskeletal protein RodZ